MIKNKLNKNSKGMTIIELLVCFILVSVITTSLFATISTFSNKRDKEAVKDAIYSYKNRVVKEIQYDLVNKKLVKVDVVDPRIEASVKTYVTSDIFTYTYEPANNTYRYKVTLSFSDGYKRVITIRQKSSEGYIDEASESDCSRTKINDDFYITYGPDAPSTKDEINNPTSSSGDFTLYRLPNIGESENDCGESVLDFRIDDVTVSAEGNVFKLYIGFYHPDVGKEYAIDIVAPMNYFAE